jgi:DNA-binding response OmpR family regulator
MSFQDYNILIVDDDKSFANSLKEAFTRSGFRCYVVHDPKDALNYAKLQDVHVLLIDCMLPKMNGLELVKKLKESITSEPHLFLMSGIFKDKQFMSTAIKKTNAVDFLSKPIELPKFVAQIESLFSGVKEDVDNFNPLVRLYLERLNDKRKIIKLINNAEGLHNFDLPWVFKLLMDSKATGHLNIACTNGDIAGVGFSKGSIVQVNIKNEASLLGLLLVEQGFLDRSDLNEALEANSNNKLLGQHLIEANLVSPHAISIVLKEQLIWRLKRLIADSQMELNFVKSDDIATITNISDGDFSQFVIETIENTIRPDWLKTHYLPLSENLISLNNDATSELSKARLYPYISRTFPSFEALLSRGTSLDEIITNNPSIENHVLKVIHFLNIMKMIEIKKVSKILNFSHQTKRLQKLQVELESKNYFERLGVSRSAKENDIKKAYFDLAKVLHPDKLNESTPEQIRDLSEKVFAKIQIAYDTLKKEDRKEKYLEELNAGQSEKLMQGDQLFDVGKALLAKGQYSQAKRQIQKALKLNPDSPDIKIHSLWTEIKSNENISDGFIADVDKKLNLIPIESRDNATYYHVRGLYFKLLNDNEKARKYFQTALNIDNAFISARRELSQLTSRRESTNILTADLKDMVGFLFKK